MLDINRIEKEQAQVEELLHRKGWDIDLTPLIQDVATKRATLFKIEQVKAEVNRLSGLVPSMKKAGQDVQPLFAQVKQLNASIVDEEIKLKKLETKINETLFALPNLPDPDLKSGGKENNEVIEVYNQKPSFDFKIKDHVELATSLGLIDYGRAAKISGAGTWIYTGLGARLEWALLNFFINEHLNDGYEFILPPHLLNEDSGFTAGQFPKFKQDVFWLDGVEPKRFLLPTAETALVNLHRNEILKEADLPKRYFAYTPCYRSEAGSYRSEERGMIRGYQFNKVEIVQYTSEDGSDVAFGEMVNKAVNLVKKLGLHFQVSKLAAGDCSHSMARTHDIEVYIPSMGIYKEVSSASNARDYQARRGMMRYRDSNGKIHFCHTLNASGLATSRLIPAILEQYQLPDGSVKVPDILVPMLGIDIIKGEK